MTLAESPPFSIEALVDDLRAVAQQPNSATEVRNIMDMIFENPVGVSQGMPSYEEDDVVLFEDDTISIWHCRFQPGNAVPPHDHQVAAIIGVYRGVERNDFFQAGESGKISKGKAVEMAPGTVLSIGPSAIHSVECISESPSCGIHVYLGPLTRIERNLFDVKTGERMRYTEEAYDRLKVDALPCRKTVR